MKYFIIIIVLLFAACKNSNDKITVTDYFNYGDTSVRVAGIKMIPVKTPVGEFKVGQRDLVIILK